MKPITKLITAMAVMEVMEEAATMKSPAVIPGAGEKPQNLIKNIVKSQMNWK